MAAGTTLTVAGTLTLTSGTLNQAGPTGILAAQGDVNARIGFTGGGTATLLINGCGGTQTLRTVPQQRRRVNAQRRHQQDSGVLTITGTLRTGRNWTYTSGGLVVTGSTLVFTGSSATTITGSHTLNNVEIRGARSASRPARR